MTGAEIKTIREQLGLTQANLGQLLGVHHLTISRWERGDLQPSPYHVALMQSFDRARKRSPNIGAAVAGLIVGAGIGVALYHLLQAAFAPESGAQQSKRRPPARK